MPQYSVLQTWHLHDINSVLLPINSYCNMDTNVKVYIAFVVVVMPLHVYVFLRVCVWGFVRPRPHVPGCLCIHFIKHQKGTTKATLQQHDINVCSCVRGCVNRQVIKRKEFLGAFLGILFISIFYIGTSEIRTHSCQRRLNKLCRIKYIH